MRCTAIEGSSSTSGMVKDLLFFPVFFFFRFFYSGFYFISSCFFFAFSFLFKWKNSSHKNKRSVKEFCSATESEQFMVNNHCRRSLERRREKIEKRSGKAPAWEEVKQKLTKWENKLKIIQGNEQKPNLLKPSGCAQKKKSWKKLKRGWPIIRFFFAFFIIQKNQKKCFLSKPTLCLRWLRCLSQFHC